MQVTFVGSTLQDILKDMAEFTGGVVGVNENTTTAAQDAAAKDEKPKRTRRAKKDAEPKAEDKTEEKPKRTRRTKKDTEEKPADEGKSAEEEAPKRSRRRTAAEPDPEPSTDISDVELSTAASNGAETLTPDGVMEIIASYDGVKDVSDIPQEDREQFLSIVDAACEIGLDGMDAVLDVMKVGGVNELVGNQRAEFLDILKEFKS